MVYTYAEVLTKEKRKELNGLIEHQSIFILFPVTEVAFLIIFIFAKNTYISCYNLIYI